MYKSNIFKFLSNYIYINIIMSDNFNKTVNNKYFDAPARMDDGCTFTDNRASSSVDNMCNYEYRQFLIKIYDLYDKRKDEEESNKKRKIAQKEVIKSIRDEIYSGY